MWSALFTVAFIIAAVLSVYAIATTRLSADAGTMDVIGNAVHVMRIATGEIEETSHRDILWSLRLERSPRI